MDTAVWGALADENRRAILARLLTGPQPVGELAERCGLSQPSMSKHLRVLREAGLVRVRVDAQRRVYALEPAPMAELDAWLAPYRRLWNRSLDALGRRLDEAHAGSVERSERSEPSEQAASATSAEPAALAASAAADPEERAPLAPPTRPAPPRQPRDRKQP